MQQLRQEVASQSAVLEKQSCLLRQKASLLENAESSARQQISVPFLKLGAA